MINFTLNKGKKAEARLKLSIQKSPVHHIERLTRGTIVNNHIRNQEQATPTRVIHKVKKDRDRKCKEVHVTSRENVKK